MTIRIRKWVCICGLLAATAMSSGCSTEMWRHMAYLGWGGRGKKVKAKFAGLAGKTVAVVVYSDRRTLYEFPDLNLTLSAAIAGRLDKNVKNIKVVPPARVVRYQDENIYWEEMDKADLGKALGADFVLYVPMEEFGTRLPDSSYLYQGRATCEPAVYDVTKLPKDSRVYKGEKIRILYPEHEPAGALNENDRQIRITTEAMFADKLTKLFYAHKEEVPR